MKREMNDGLQKLGEVVVLFDVVLEVRDSAVRILAAAKVGPLYFKFKY